MSGLRCERLALRLGAELQVGPTPFGRGGGAAVRVGARPRRARLHARLDAHELPALLDRSHRGRVDDEFWLCERAVRPSEEVVHGPRARPRARPLKVVQKRRLGCAAKVVRNRSGRVPGSGGLASCVWARVTWVGIS